MIIHFKGKSCSDLGRLLVLYDLASHVPISVRVLVLNDPPGWSIGAAVGPMMTGWISAHTNDWNNVFFMLYAADLIAGLLLTRLVFKEIRNMPI
jgi:MFS family permease